MSPGSELCPCIMCIGVTQWLVHLCFHGTKTHHFTSVVRDKNDDVIVCNYDSDTSGSLKYRTHSVHVSVFTLCVQSYVKNVIHFASFNVYLMSSDSSSVWMTLAPAVKTAA